MPNFVIPAIARDGDNMVHRSERMDWYSDATLVAALDSFRSQSDLAALALRLPIQDVYKFDDRRILAGRIASGRLRSATGCCSRPPTRCARQSIEGGMPRSPTRDRPAESIGITTDEQIFVERGEIASHETHPPIETNVFRGRLFWLGRKPLARAPATGCGCRPATCR